MRVAALELPVFSLQVALRERPDLAGQPVLLVARERGIDRVVAVTAEARVQGARPGQTTAQAQALVAGAQLLRLDETRRLSALQALAEALCALAPVVELAPPDAVLLDASAARLVGGAGDGRRRRDGLLPLLGLPEKDGPNENGRGLDTLTAQATQLALAMSGPRPPPGEALWAEAVLETARTHGFVGRLAIAPTAACARLLAASAAPGEVRLAVVASAASEVPLDVVQRLSLEQESSARPVLPVLAPTSFGLLAGLGLSRLGDVARIPAKTLVHRLGADGDRLVLLARGGGERPLVPFEPAQAVVETLSFDAPVEQADGLVFALRPAVERLASRLEARGLATSRLLLQLDRLARPEEVAVRPPAPAGELPVLPRVSERLVFDLARPAAGAKALLDVLRDRLRELSLPAPVTSLVLAAAETVDRMRQLALGERPRAWEALDGVVARLQARFGEGAVGSLATTDDWLPERESMRAPFRPPDRTWGEGTAAADEPGEGPESDEPGRPTRLFGVPEPLAPELDGAGRLRAVVWRGLRRRVLAWSGAERVALDWWNTAQVRDYTTLLLGDGPRLWAYRDAEGRWWAQGLHD